MNKTYVTGMILLAIAMIVMAILSSPQRPAKTTPVNRIEARTLAEWNFHCRTSDGRLVGVVPSRSVPVTPTNEAPEQDDRIRGAIEHSVRCQVSGMTFEELVRPDGVEKVRAVLASHGFNQLKIEL